MSLVFSASWTHTLGSHMANVTAAATADESARRNAELDGGVDRLKSLMAALCGTCDIDAGWRCEGHSAPEH